MTTTIETTKVWTNEEVHAAAIAGQDFLLWTLSFAAKGKWPTRKTASARLRRTCEAAGADRDLVSEMLGTAYPKAMRP